MVDIDMQALLGCRLLGLPDSLRRTDLHVKGRMGHGMRHTPRGHHAGVPSTCPRCWPSGRPRSLPAHPPPSHPPSSFRIPRCPRRHCFAAGPRRGRRRLTKASAASESSPRRPSTVECGKRFEEIYFSWTFVRIFTSSPMRRILPSAMPGNLDSEPMHMAMVTRDLQAAMGSGRPPRGDSAWVRCEVATATAANRRARRRKASSMGG